MQRFRDGLVFKAHRLLYHLTLGVAVIKKKKKFQISGVEVPGLVFRVSRFRVAGFGFQVSGFGFRVSSLGFRALGFRFRGLPPCAAAAGGVGVYGLWFRVSGFGFQERCPPRQTSRVERLKAKVQPLLIEVTVDCFASSLLLSSLEFNDTHVCEP